MRQPPLTLRSRRVMLTSGLAAACLAAIATILLLWSRASAEEFGFAWQPGQQYVYRVVYESDNQTLVGLTGGVSSFEAQTRLVATVALRAYERVGKRTRLGLVIEHVEDGRLEALGTLYAANRGELAKLLEGVEAVLEVGADGRVASLSLDPRLSQAQAGMMQSLAAALEVVVEPGKPSWSVTQDNPLGQARQRYRWAPRLRKLAVSREVEGYDKLLAVNAPPRSLAGQVVGQATAQLEPEGFLLALFADEAVELSNDSGTSAVKARSHVEATLLSRGAIPALALESLRARLAALVPRGLSEVAVDAQLIDNSLVQRAAGMTPQGILADIRAYGGNRMPFHSQWVWRATGALRLYPEAAASLAELFAQPDTSTTARGLIVDLLVAATVPATEAALCDLLASEQARALPEYAAWLQRAGLQATPTKQTAQLLFSAYDQAEALGERAEATRLASAVALGSTAGRLLDAGDDQTADLATERLNQWLANARTDESRAAYLLALGNTHFEEQAEVIAAHASSDSPEVRRATATALGHIVSSESEKGLASLVADADPLVQYQALLGLQEQERSAPTVGAVATALSSGRVDKQGVTLAASLLLSGIDRATPGSEAARAALQQLIDQDIPAQLRYAITSSL